MNMWDHLNSDNLWHRDQQARKAKICPIHKVPMQYEGHCLWCEHPMFEFYVGEFNPCCGRNGKHADWCAANVEWLRRQVEAAHETE